jgi:hypothetical protein
MSQIHDRRIWPLSLAASEGFATARFGRWTSLLVIFAIAWCVAAPAAADAIGVTRLIQGEQAWIDAGGYVLVVTGARNESGTNPVPGAVCDRLTEIEGISAAFALQTSGARAAFTHIPGGRAPIYEVSPGAARFLGATPTASATVIVTSGLAQRTGVRDAEDVRLVLSAGGATTAKSGVLTARAVDSAVLGEEYDGALLVPAILTGDVSTCFVRTDAAHHKAVATALPALLAYGGQPALAQPRLFSSDFTVDYTSAYEDRDLRWLWVPAAALLALIWMITQWFRRSQLAIYVTFGMKPAPRLVMQVSEWAVLVAFGLPWGWGLGIVWALALGASVETALTQVSLHAILTVLAASVVVVLFGLRPTGSLLDALKDRT